MTFHRSNEPTPPGLLALWLKPVALGLLAFAALSAVAHGPLYVLIDGVDVGFDKA